MDNNYINLAKVLCRHSTRLSAGENVLIDVQDTPSAFVEALVDEVNANSARAFVEINDARISRKLYINADEEQLECSADLKLQKIKKMQAYIAIRGSQNIFENSDISASKMAQISKIFKESIDYRVNKTKWVVLRWPTPAMAQQAQMSTSAFEDFYFRVCTMDYSKMESGANALKALMEKTDKVDIKAEGVDLHFSIKSIPSIICIGEYNIPDGEVFTAPVKDSVEGYIKYNAPTVYNGVSFDGVELFFEKGKIVKANSNSNQDKLRSILSSDEGASYIGEFALGFNPHIKEPMRDILFDEKIAGSFHFTPGQAYEQADNTNKSRIHWDLVSIQTPEYGGGEIYFDGKLIRKDGLFIGEGIEQLNPENLI